VTKTIPKNCITIPDFKLYYRTIIIITTTCYWHNRYSDQWNRIEDPDINPYTYNKEGRNTHWEKTSSINGVDQMGWIHIYPEFKQSHTLDPAQNSTPNGSKTSI
jgi:G:T-mismatch repair DNA endonuclease (very short patch repair protein)